MKKTLVTLFVVLILGGIIWLSLHIVQTGNDQERILLIYGLLGVLGIAVAIAYIIVSRSRQLMIEKEMMLIKYQVSNHPQTMESIFIKLKEFFKFSEDEKNVNSFKQQAVKGLVLQYTASTQLEDFCLCFKRDYQMTQQFDHLPSIFSEAMNTKSVNDVYKALFSDQIKSALVRGSEGYSKKVALLYSLADMLHPYFNPYKDFRKELKPVDLVEDIN